MDKYTFIQGTNSKMIKSIDDEMKHDSINQSKRKLTNEIQSRVLEIIDELGD